MNQNIEAFLIKMDNDPEFGAKVWAASEVEELVRLAREEGFSFDADDLARATAGSDEELDEVSGGSSANQRGLNDRRHELMADEQRYALSQGRPEMLRRVASLVGRLSKA